MSAKQRRKWRRKFFTDRNAFMRKFSKSKWDSRSPFLPREIGYKNERTNPLNFSE